MTKVQYVKFNEFSYFTNQTYEKHLSAKKFNS